MDKFKKFLKSLGYSDEDITKIVDGMKSQKLFITNEENIEIRYKKNKTKLEDLEKDLETANNTIEDLRKNSSEDPKDSEIEKIRLELEAVRQDALKKDLTNKAYLLADEKKLPKEMIPYLLGDDEETTTENINKIAELFDTHITSQVDDRLKNGYKPPKGEEPKIGGIGSQLAKQATDNQDAMLEAQKNYFS